MFLLLKSFLADRWFTTTLRKAVTTCRQHHSTMKGYKNWCNAMTGASRIMETMSKSSVQYVHQMAIYMVCNIFWFFLSSPSELTFWITYICNTSFTLFWVSLWCLIFLQYQLSFISFTCIAQGDVDLHFSLMLVRKTIAVEEETEWAAWLYHRCNQSMHLT